MIKDAIFAKIQLYERNYANTIRMKIGVKKQLATQDDTTKKYIKIFLFHGVFACMVIGAITGTDDLQIVKFSYFSGAMIVVLVMGLASMFIKNIPLIVITRGAVFFVFMVMYALYIILSRNLLGIPMWGMMSMIYALILFGFNFLSYEAWEKSKKTLFVVGCAVVFIVGLIISARSSLLIEDNLSRCTYEYELFIDDEYVKPFYCDYIVDDTRHRGFFDMW